MSKPTPALQYWDISVGNGKVAKEGDHVRVHYTGWLTNGKKFDSSVDAGSPSISDRQRRSDQRMGRRRRRHESRRQAPVAHSARLGLRRKGTPADIPPNATLIFDVQLLAVVTCS